MATIWEAGLGDFGDANAVEVEADDVAIVGFLKASLAEANDVAIIADDVEADNVAIVANAVEDETSTDSVTQYIILIGNNEGHEKKILMILRVRSNNTTN